VKNNQSIKKDPKSRIYKTELEANKIGNKEELNELSNTSSVEQPKRNMSRTHIGTLIPMTRIAPAEVINYKSMVPEPEWFNGDKKMFENW